jgi:hypothetical protein
MTQTIDLHSSDAVTWARSYTGDPFHALLCDPPYHLTSIVKRFGKNGAAPAQYGTDGVFSRSSAGFMGKKWDGGDAAFNPETWDAFKSVMYPGAFGMAFASSRGWHRLACAIEDAGFVIHPSIFGWAYGSGFPKATRVNHGAKGFDGHRYGLQALKPALEPIIVFQKPYEGRPIDNITQTGAGCLNVDGGRIGLQEGETTFGSGVSQSNDPSVSYGDMGTKRVGVPNIHSTQGRWPANFCLDDEAARRLDEQSGTLKSGKVLPHHQAHESENLCMSGKNYARTGIETYGDSGGASRFFFRVSEQLDDADPVRYYAKASRGERDAGLEGMPLGGNDWHRKTSGMNKGPSERNGGETTKHFPLRNPHPTVKPLALARYLATLLLPPVEYAPRRLFVPFAGVASECIGAMQAGWEQVTGVELTEEYIPIARARVEYWQSKTRQTEFA